jgi:integrase
MKHETQVASRKIGMQTKLSDWPVTDQELWRKALEAGDILSPVGAGAKWAEGTRKTVIKSYGRWLAWFATKDYLSVAASPAKRTTPEAVAAYIGHLRDGKAASTTVWSYIHGLAMALMVMEPEEDIEWLWEIERRLGRIKTPVRRKAERIVPIAELYRLGFELMDKAASATDQEPLAGARLFRNGLMIAILAARPIRIRNLRSMEIGKNLFKSNGRYYLRYQANETKTHKALEFDVPQNLSTRIDIYLSHYRPMLFARRRVSPSEEQSPIRNAMWISRFGTAMSDQSIYTAVSDSTRKQFERHVNPHLFRDCAATTIALEDADHVHITTSILGHACLSTSERYYNHALSQRAVSMHQAGILAARKGARHKKGANQRSA